METTRSRSFSRWSAACTSAALFLPFAHGELVVNSSNGYQVHVYIQLTHVVPSTMTCPWGYNWNVALNYNVWFTGSNIPANLYTLQGRVVCGSQQLFFDLPNTGGDGSLVTGENPWRGVSDCATVTLATLGCNNTLIEIQGPGINAQTISYTPDLLPIELIAFAATPEEQHVRLDWATATESNNDHFTVERSQDGIAFEPVALVPGAGNSQEMILYTSLDRLVPEGVLYYRLKQTDIDGQYSYSPTVSVTGTSDPEPVVAPNPCSSDLLTLSGDVIGHVLEVRSATGETVRSMPIASNAIHLPGLAPGLYVLHVIDPLSGQGPAVRLVRQ